MHCKRLSLILLLALAACGGDDDGEDRQQQQQRTAAGRDSVVRQPVYAEAEAAQILRAINADEIATARVARERSQNLDILRYASVMIADHGAMTELLDSIVPPISDSVNAVSRTIREESAALVDTLWALQGGFNNTYIQQQIAAHERALQLLDTVLIPSARTPELKQLMQDLRPTMLAHWQRARQIWAERQASGLAAQTAPQPAQTQPAQPTPAQPQPAQQPPAQQPPAQRPPAQEPAAPPDTFRPAPPPPLTTTTNM